MNPSVEAIPQVGVAIQHQWDMGEWLPFERLPVDAYEILLDPISGPLDGPQIVQPDRLAELAPLRARRPLLAHSNFGGEKSFLPLEETLTVRRHVPLARHLEALWVSDHCFYGAHALAEVFTYPLQWSRAEVKRLAPRLKALQQMYGIPLLHENPAYYFRPLGSDLPEAEFLARLVEESGTYLHLDLHNVYTNTRNFDGYTWKDYLNTIPVDRVLSIHLAGGVMQDGVYHDSHDQSTPAPVWEMLEEVLRLTKVRAVIVEYEGVLETLSGEGPVQTVRKKHDPGAAREMIIADLEKAAEIWDKVYGPESRYSTRPLQ